MYILMISRGFPTAEYPQWGCFEKDQAEALAALGHKVVVMSVDARLQKNRGKLGLKNFTINGVEYYNYITLPGSLFLKTIGPDKYIKWIKYPLYYKKLFNKIVKDHGLPNLIYSQFFWNTVMGVKIKEDTGIPVIGIEHLARFNNQKLSANDYKWALYAFENSDASIAVSQSLANNLQKHFNLSFEVVHNMYGREFQPTEPLLKWDSSKVLKFISAASLIKRKGFDILIKAFAEANIPIDKWELDIIGDGEEKENLLELIKEKKLEKNIHLLGKKSKNQIVEQLEQSQVYILPSKNENFSVAVLEGLAMGLPVIATDCGGIRECLNDKNGMIVPVDNITALSDAIKNMFATYTQYDRNWIVSDCRRRFSSEAIAMKLEDIFEKFV
ncbi:MAG: glycosyltransferase family 4 protein [Muribaculaceae bacterium]|nr:glycosyltransferase family 4 protein [Muribaculaceae bacterium]